MQIQLSSHHQIKKCQVHFQDKSVLILIMKTNSSENITKQQTKENRRVYSEDKITQPINQLETTDNHQSQQALNYLVNISDKLQNLNSILVQMKNDNNALK